MGKIRLGIIGIGNCASALIQGINYYRNKERQEAFGLMHWDIGGYKPWDIEVAAAYDIDQRKVGLDAAEAIFAPPNCTARFCTDLAATGTTVRMGRIMDGMADHMKNYPASHTFMPAAAREPDREEIIRNLRETGVNVVLNYLPVGSEEASKFYADCALEAGAGFINGIPVFIASDSEWAAKFSRAGLPIIGDDIKSQLGATIVHRALTHLFSRRGVRLHNTYQLNFGGNTDFLNMLDRQRLASKKKSKTEAVRSQSHKAISDENIHIGPSDWVSFQKDTKTCYIRMEGSLFGDVPMNLELKLSVEDSPNSAGVMIDAIRCLMLARNRGVGGPLLSPSAFFMKHPPEQYNDNQAYRFTEEFIAGIRQR